MRLNLVAAGYALWLLATEVLFYIYYTGSDDDLVILKISVVLGLIPAAMQLILLGLNPYGTVAPVRIALCFLLIVLVGYLGNAHSTSPTWFASLVFIFATSILVASSPDERLIRSIAVFYSVPAALFLLYVATTGEHVWGRLQAHGMQPNWWGLMGAGLAMAGLAHRSRLLAMLCIGVGFYIAFDASSRSSMLSILCGLLAVGLLELRALRGSRMLIAVAMSLAALVLVLVFTTSITSAVTNIVTETMQLNDPNRGFGTGFTGRADIWEDVIQIWLKSPLFGVGFHQHEMLTIDNSEAHQVYLAALADTGILGLLWYICFLGASLYAALHITEQRTRNAIVGTIAAYVAIGFFDARGFSSGNPTSLYFAMCSFFALRHASLRRVIRDMSDALPAPSGQPRDAI